MATHNVCKGCDGQGVNADLQGVGPGLPRSVQSAWGQFVQLHQPRERVGHKAQRWSQQGARRQHAF